MGLGGWACMGIYAAGLAIETIADYQVWARRERYGRQTSVNRQVPTYMFMFMFLSHDYRLVFGGYVATILGPMILSNGCLIYNGGKR